MPPLPICATVSEASVEATLARLAALPTVELVELRLDALPSTEVRGALPALIAASPALVLATCRPERQGGGWLGDEGERVQLLHAAAEAGAEWIDVEHDALADFERLRAERDPISARVVVSRHPPPAESESDLAELLASLRGEGASVQKLALPTDDALVALRLLRLAGAEVRPTIAIGMGFPGVVSRLAGCAFGAPWTYAASDPERPAAPGQLSVETLRALVPRRPDAETSLYGVLGSPVDHSRSPHFHNAGFAACEHAGVYTWLETGDPLGLLEEAQRDPRWRGFSVTIPHKQAFVDLPNVELDESARAIGAINTLARTGEAQWRATNTDALATTELTRRALGDRLRGARVALLGYGGAARAAGWALREAGAAVEVFGRDRARGEAFASELRLVFSGSLLEVRRDHDLIVNATPVGMGSGKPSPIAADVFHHRAVAYDLVYTPERTQFLEDARARGAATITGVEHFRAQAEAQLALFVD